MESVVSEDPFEIEEDFSTEAYMSSVTVVGAVTSVLKAPKPRFNYFVGLKLESPAFYAAVNRLKGDLEKINPKYKKIFTQTEKMHLTLVLTTLEDEESTVRAQTAIASCENQWGVLLRQAGSRTLELPTLGTFGSNVLWLGPEKGSVLDAVRAAAECMYNALIEAGLTNTSLSSELHATIAKTNFKTKKFIKIRKADYSGISLRTPTSLASSTIMAAVAGPATEIDVLAVESVETMLAAEENEGDGASDRETESFAIANGNNDWSVELDRIDLLKIGSNDKATGYYQSIQRISAISCPPPEES